jgi:very-short-patch-repair endonuclease
MLTPRDPRLKKFARVNRKVPTLSEAQLWHELRDKKLAGLKFRRQHPIYPFIVDFYCPAFKLVIEVDGDIHDLPEHHSDDSSRQANLESRGFRVLRFQADAVIHNMENVLREIAGSCEIEYPSPQGGGE